MNTFRDWDINPVTAAEVKDVETVEGMRRRIQRYARVDPMTRAVMDAAHYRGLSGDDTMTMLAYHALCRLEKLTDAELERISLEVPRQFILKEAPR